MPRDFPRARRIEDQILRILSDVLRNDTRDPRLGNVILTAVRVSRDLSVAWVYYSTLQAEGDSEPLDEAFGSAQGFLRSRLAKDLTVRRVPELRFELDTTGSDARAMDKLLSGLTSEDSRDAESPGSEDESDG